MDVIDFELKRYDQMKSEFNMKKSTEINVNETPTTTHAIDTLDSIEKPQEVSNMHMYIMQLLIHLFILLIY